MPTNQRSSGGCTKHGHPPAEIPQNPLPPPEPPSTIVRLPWRDTPRHPRQIVGSARRTARGENPTGREVPRQDPSRFGSSSAGSQTRHWRDHPRATGPSDGGEGGGGGRHPPRAIRTRVEARRGVEPHDRHKLRGQRSRSLPEGLSPGARTATGRWWAAGSGVRGPGSVGASRPRNSTAPPSAGGRGGRGLRRARGRGARSLAFSAGYWAVDPRSFPPWRLEKRIETGKCGACIIDS